MGSGHSFTAIALAEDVLVDLSDYDAVIAIDKLTKTVTVQSGIPVSYTHLTLPTIYSV